MNRRKLLKSLVTLTAFVAITPIVATTAKADSKKYPFTQNSRTKRAIRNGNKQRAIDLQLNQLQRYQVYLAK